MNTSVWYNSTIRNGIDKEWMGNRTFKVCDMLDQLGKLLNMKVINERGSKCNLL